MLIISSPNMFNDNLIKKIMEVSLDAVPQSPTSLILD